jgi:hypothetical protein
MVRYIRLRFDQAAGLHLDSALRIDNLHALAAAI